MTETVENDNESDTIKESVNRYLDIILKSEILEESFAGFIIYSKENDLLKIKGYEEQMVKLFNEIGPSKNNMEIAVKHYVNQISNIMSDKISNTLFSMLEFAAHNNLIQQKLICESILICDKLQYQNETFWCNGFTLIGKIINTVEYKGVRDLLKIILDKVNQIPSECNISIIRLLNVMYEIFEHIFDRNASLLPGYLILDEIQKKIHPKGKWPHWKFAKLISSFIDTFHPTAQMVSIAGRSKLLPIVGYSSTSSHIWKLDPITARFQLRGMLPYNKDLMEPQTNLLRYVLEQPYSRDMVCVTMLGLSNKLKQRCPILEEQLVELIVNAMERSENETDLIESNDGNNPTLSLWQHLSSHLIYFVLFHHASFPHMVQSLQDKLSNKNLRKGREHLMWILLQFLSGSIQKNPLNDFLPIMKLYDLLYPEREPIPVPDVSKSSSTHTMAISSIWIHLMKKAEAEAVKIQRPVPQALKTHISYLHENLSNNIPSNLSDYRITLLCNAYSTNQEYFSRPMGILFDTVRGSNCGNSGNGPVSPLSMVMLDSLTVHTKMSLIHNIATHIMKSAQSKANICLSPAMIETYSRLLIYTEIESLGIKGFMTQILTSVWRSQAWSILHTLLEMFVYRLHHIPAHYRVQLLGHLHTLSNVPLTNQLQLHLCMESTALKLILSLSSPEVLTIPQFSRFQNEPKALLSTESEELNKAFVLTLARGIHVTYSETLSASWIKEILSTITQSTPLSWSSFTLMCFPSVISDYYQQMAPIQKENKLQLKISVEEEYRKWKTMNNENDMLKHFSLQNTPPLFLCLLWKMLLDNERINPIAYKILDRIGARALSSHLRTFADFLVVEFSNLVGGQHVNKFIDALNDLIWKCHVITLDRLLLCLALRSFEGNEAQVCFFIIHMLLLKPSEFKNRVYEFVKENSPEHWKQSYWHDKHMAFHRKFPEKFYFEGLQEVSGQSSQHNYLPVFFSNVCLRFIPVLDIIIHRFLELPSGSGISNIVETLLDQLGCLYKFHDKPITYLYNTLHYYEKKLKDRPQLKRKLVSAIIGSLKDIKPKNWALSDSYYAYMQRTSEDIDFNPGLEYYIQLISRVVDTLSGALKSPFPHTDYRFNEFPNASAHALHATCIELMALPVNSANVANSLLDVVLIGHKILPRGSIEIWMNAIGLVLISLPESYWSVLNDRILEMMQNPILTNSNDPFELMDFTNSHMCMNEMQCSYLIALTHAVWHHASVGQISLMPQFLKEKIKPALKTEEQFIFICHIVGPFLQRFYVERTRCVMDLTIELYEMLEIVDKNCEKLKYIDAICDLLYHIKYMFTGDCVKSEAEKTIRNLKQPLQMRLRFITHLNIDESMIS